MDFEHSLAIQKIAALEAENRSLREILAQANIPAPPSLPWLTPAALEAFKGLPETQGRDDLDPDDLDAGC